MSMIEKERVLLNALIAFFTTLSAGIAVGSMDFFSVAFLNAVIIAIIAALIEVKRDTTGRPVNLSDKLMLI